MQIPQPMPLQKRLSPFDDPDWIFELKYDGFRALAVLRDGGAQLISRNAAPVRLICGPWQADRGGAPGVTDTVLDGEIVCVTPQASENQPLSLSRERLFIVRCATLNYRVSPALW